MLLTGSSWHLSVSTTTVILEGPQYRRRNCFWGIGYSVVAVIYSIRNNFITQFRCRGRWFKHDCMQGNGITTSSTEFDGKWYLELQRMFVYLRASMVSLISSTGH